MEVLRLHCRRSDMARCTVLDVLGQCLEVRHVAWLVLADVIVRPLIGGHHFWRRLQGGRGGREGRNVCCCVVFCSVTVFGGRVPDLEQTLDTNNCALN
jgi:hypothetical protein